MLPVTEKISQRNNIRSPFIKVLSEACIHPQEYEPNVLISNLWIVYMLKPIWSMDSNIIKQQNDLLQRSNIDNYWLCSNLLPGNKSPISNIWEPHIRANDESTNHWSTPQVSPRKRRRRNINQVLKGFEYRYVNFTNNDYEASKLIQCWFKDCGKLFTKSWNFLDHARTHKGIKPYECRYCKKRYTQKGNMMKHQKQHIIKDIEERKIFRCFICSKGYTENFNLRVSILYCSTCDKVISLSLFYYEQFQIFKELKFNKIVNKRWKYKVINESKNSFLVYHIKLFFNNQLFIWNFHLSNREIIK